MHFLADVYVPCEVCHGSRYNRETLEVRYKGKNISEVLDMTAEEALDYIRTTNTQEDRAAHLVDMADLSARSTFVRNGNP